MKKLFLLIGVICCFTGFAQDSATLNILGQAKKRVMPDKAVINIILSSSNKDESESLVGLNEISSQVLKKLKSLGFVKEQIKMNGLSVSSHNISLDKKKKELRYTSTQDLSVKFPLDRVRILKIYGSLFEDKLEGVELSFSTEFSDSLKAITQNELIVSAISDAQSKAELIATATKNKIKSIKAIGFNVNTVNTEEDTYQIMKFTPPLIKQDEEVNNNNLNYFTINEEVFREEIKITYFLEK